MMEFEDKRMVYEGDFIAGTMTGKGKMSFSNGMQYIGEWSDDLFCGEGSLSILDGRVIIGTWLECNLIEGSIQSETVDPQLHGSTIDNIELNISGSVEASKTSYYSAISFQKSLDEVKTFVKIKMKPYISVMQSKALVKA